MPDLQQQRIASLEAELAALRADMQDYTYTVSHDLRAPLRHILSYARLVQEEAGPQLPDDAKDFLQTIADSAQHMGALMDGLAELSRVGTAPLQCVPVPLSDVLQDAMAQAMQQHAGRAVQWDVGTDLPDVLADATLLRRALECLLDNALKFSGPRSVATVVITAERLPGDGPSDERWVKLCIRDNGVGFNPALQTKLFKPFQRLHSTSQFPGIGMGLALTHQIAQRLGGSVTAEGAVDSGCRVALCLPGAESTA